MKKVLIIDDSLVHIARSLNGYDTHDRTKKIDVSTLQQLSKQLDGTSTLDVTACYKSRGGSQDIQLLVATEPRTSLGSNELYKRPEQDVEKMVQTNFNLDRATSIIKETKPDLILLDLGFPARLAEDVAEHYTLHGPTVQPFALGRYATIFPMCSFGRKYDTVNGDYKIYDKAKEKWRTHEVFRNIQFEKSTPEKTYWWEEPSKFVQERAYHPCWSGGVQIGYRLHKEKIPFTFWTSDIGHAKGGLDFAYTLGIRNAEDIITLEAAFLHREYAQTDEEVSDREPIMNSSGNIAVQSKLWLLSGEDNSKFSQVEIFDRIIARKLHLEGQK